MRSTAIQPPAAPLTDGVVCLRCRRAADLDAICAASYDPGIQRWLTDPPMDDQARAASLARVAEAFRTGRSAPLVIADGTTDQPVGLINVQFRDDQLATIAYSVFPGTGVRAWRRARCGWRRPGPFLSWRLVSSSSKSTRGISRPSGSRRNAGLPRPAAAPNREQDRVGRGPNREPGRAGKLVFALRAGETGQGPAMAAENRTS